MRIESLYDPRAAGAPSAGAQGAAAADFREALARAGSTGTADAGRAQEEKPTPEEMAATRAALLKEIEDYMKKSPVEHMREKILKQKGLSEESLAQMPPEERAEIEEEIGRRIKEWLLRDSDTAQEETAAPAVVAQGAAAAGDSPAGMSAFVELRASLAAAARGA